MTTERIRAWVDANGLEKSAARIGISTTTLARYVAGGPVPASRLPLLELVVEAWEASKEGSEK